ncbi:hypothetical protein JOM56_012866 [Amanita muscaria]
MTVVMNMGDPWGLSDWFRGSAYISTFTLQTLLKGKGDRRVWHFTPLPLPSYTLTPYPEGLLYPCKTLIDRDGNLVGLVIRDFCKEILVLNWINGLIKRAVGLKKSCQPNDPGKLVIIGYSPGSRSRPSFGWVRNITRKISEGDLHDFNAQCSSAFAFFWNLARSWLPPEIIKDFDDFIGANNLLLMNRTIQMLRSRTYYNILTIRMEGSVTYCRGIALDQSRLYTA